MQDGPTLRDFPWTRSLLAMVVIGPPLAIGGVFPLTVPLFIFGVLLLLLRLSYRGGGQLMLPRAATAVGVMATFLTFLQWIPLPDWLRSVLAPRLTALTSDVLNGTAIDSWSRLSIIPGATAVEVGRLGALTGLFVAGAQLSWRTTAGMATACGTLMAIIGFSHSAFDAKRIFGIYEPVDREFVAYADPLLTSFVNPNHQAALFLLGIFSAAALALDQYLSLRKASELRRLRRYSDRTLASTAAMFLQVVALALSHARGAIIVFCLIAAAAAVVAMRIKARDSTRRAVKRRVAAIALASVAAGGLGGLVSGAWREFAQLRLDRSEPKLQSIVDSVDLVGLSPVLGIGRGTFVDLFPMVDQGTTGRLFTHLECAPMAMLVEWGPLGACLAAAMTAWWLHAFLRAKRAPRRIALLGVLAVALQNAADFNLQMLGVTPALIVVAGSLTPAKEHRFARNKLFVVWGMAAAGLFAVAASGVSGSWSSLRDLHSRVQNNEVNEADALAMRPLDPLLHLTLARSAASEGDWERALVRSRAAGQLMPSSVDARLLQGAAHAAVGERGPADSAISAALDRLREPPPPALIEYLRTSYDAEALALLAPREERPWRMLMESLMDAAPAYADVMARAREALDPNDPTPIHFRARLALEGGRPALALHHARLYSQLVPNEAAGYLLLVRAERLWARPDVEARVQMTLEQALKDHVIDDPAVLEEQLIASYLRDGSARALNMAQGTATQLLERQGDATQRAKRRELADRVRAARP